MNIIKSIPNVPIVYPPCIIYCKYLLHYDLCSVSVSINVQISNKSETTCLCLPYGVDVLLLGEYHNRTITFFYHQHQCRVRQVNWRRPRTWTLFFMLNFTLFLNFGNSMNSATKSGTYHAEVSVECWY